MENNKKPWDKVITAEYLNCDDLMGKEVKLEITSAREEEIFIPQKSQKEKVIILRFKGTDKKMIVGNLVNSRRISQIAGTKIFNDWAGTTITLRAEPDKRFDEVLRVKPQKKSVSETEIKALR